MTTKFLPLSLRAPRWRRIVATGKKSVWDLPYPWDVLDCTTVMNGSPTDSPSRRPASWCFWAWLWCRDRGAGGEGTARAA